MSRLLTIPVVIGAIFLSTACSGGQTAAKAPVTNSPAATPLDSAPPTAPVEKTDDAPDAIKPTTTAARTKTGTAAKTNHERPGGNATFPISPGTHMVLLHSYDSAKHTAVIEPAAFTADGQSVTGDGNQYTLPVKASPKVFSTNGGNPDCMDGTGHHTTGSCLTDSTWLKKQLNPAGFLVTIANTGDFIYEIAEQYRP